VHPGTYILLPSHPHRTPSTGTSASPGTDSGVLGVLLGPSTYLSHAHAGTRCDSQTLSMLLQNPTRCSEGPTPTHQPTNPPTPTHHGNLPLAPPPQYCTFQSVPVPLPPPQTSICNLLTPKGPGCSTSTTSCTACSTDLRMQAPAARNSTHSVHIVSISTNH
jgi:hypothetical protein